MREYKQIDKAKLNKLHEVEQEILDEIDRICRKNKLSYQLSGGTLLGAVRHKGFIPWDDDIDITMIREDYDKFIKIAQLELKDEYFIQCYETDDCYFPFIKIRKNNTLLDEKEISHLDCNKGIFVDIFPFEKINNPNSKVLKIKAVLIKNIWETILVKKGVFKTYKETRHPIFSRILGIFSYNYLKNIQTALMKSANVKEGEYLCALCGGYNYKKDIHKYSEMMPAKEIEFEKKKYYSYKNPDHYLTNLYGKNYMELPPKEKRVNHAPENIIFDLKKEKK